MAQNEHQEDSPATSTFRLLIADDDPPTRILLRAATSQWGYETVEASNGEEAWKILQLPNPPILLIVDWLMPKLDGIDLCQRIRKELITPPFPYIILLTQMTGAENVIKGLEAGANEFLSKPFNMAELRSRLSVGRRIIEYERMLQELRTQLEKISNLALSSSEKLTTLRKSNQTNSDNAIKIDETIKNLEFLSDICKKIKLYSDKKI